MSSILTISYSLSTSSSANFPEHSKEEFEGDILLGLSVAKSLTLYIFLAVGLYLVPSIVGGSFVDDG